MRTRDAELRGRDDDRGPLDGEENNDESPGNWVLMVGVTQKLSLRWLNPQLSFIFYPATPSASPPPGSLPRLLGEDMG